MWFVASESLNARARSTKIQFVCTVKFPSLEPSVTQNFR